MTINEQNGMSGKDRRIGEIKKTDISFYPLKSESINLNGKKESWESSGTNTNTIVNCKIFQR